MKFRGVKYRERPIEAIPEEELWKIDVAYSAGLNVGMVNTTLALMLLHRANRWALDTGEPRRIARALASAASLLGFEGKGTRSLATSWHQMGVELAETVNDPFLSAFIAFKAVIISWSFGEWTQVLKDLEHCEKLATEGRVSLTGSQTLRWHFVLDSLMLLGRWKEYLANTQQHLEEARRRGDQYAISMMLVHSHLQGFISDQPELTEDLIRQGWETWPQKGNVMGVYWGLHGRVEAALYRRQGQVALELIREHQSELNRNTHFKFVQVLYLIMICLQGRAALSAAESTPRAGGYFGARSRLLRSAARQAGKIERAKASWANPLATLLRAGIASVQGQSEEALRLLTQAEEEFHTADMEMYAAAARRQRGKLLGGDEGTALIASADAFMAEQDVKVPERIAAMLAPGFEGK
jgi:hypothetical protein